MGNGKFETQYVYSYGTELNTFKFKYPNLFPGPIISPDEGVHWDVKEGIGAGPILVKNYSVITNNV